MLIPELVEEKNMNRTQQVNEIQALAANIAAMSAAGDTAAELVEYALSKEGRESWGIEIELDEHDARLLETFVGESIAAEPSNFDRFWSCVKRWETRL